MQVRADLRAVSFTLDPKEKKMIQRETLAALFETYFRILKHSMNNSRFVHCVSEFMGRKDS
jgi:nucleolar complex protein 3